MTKVQNDNLRKILDWLETCPIQYSITSMSGDCVFIRCMDTSKNTFEDKVYKVLHQKGSWDIFAIQDRVNKYYVTTVKTIEQAKFYILYNLGERK